MWQSSPPRLEIDHPLPLLVNRDLDELSSPLIRDEVHKLKDGVLPTRFVVSGHCQRTNGRGVIDGSLVCNSSFCLFILLILPLSTSTMHIIWKARLLMRQAMQETSAASSSKEEKLVAL